MIAHPRLPGLPPSMPLLAAAWALSLPTASAQDDGEKPYTYHHVTDAALTAVVAWCVFAVTLEVNDFRHRLKAAHVASPESSSRTSHRYVASLVAIRYGLRDAILDWFVMYSIGYAIVAGITWTNVNPDSLYVIWGFSRIFSALILAYTGYKIPQWLGVHDKSQMQVLKDTSGIAPNAVQELMTEGSSITSFRYQVRLGVGKHLSQFVWFLLPFYVSLKPWAYLLSILIGVLFGHLFLFTVFHCRQRFRRHRGWVAACAGIVMSILSALVFTAGMVVVEYGWKRDVGNEDLLFSLSFFLWLLVCLLLLGVKYYKQLKSNKGDVSVGDDRATLFEDEENGNLDEGANEEGEVEENAAAEEGEGAGGLSEPLLGDGTNKRELLDKKKSSYMYQTVYFDHATMIGGNKHETEAMTESGTSDNAEDVDGTPKEMYATFATMETGDKKWFYRVWQCLPFQSAWRLFVLGTRDTCSCRSSEFKSKPLPHKVFFVVFKVLKICLNLLCLYVVIVELGATLQRNVTVAKLPVPHKRLYTNMDQGPVCAFDTKCGDVQTFPSKEDADGAGYTIAHCGPCGLCSNWNDFALQPIDLATPARTCGQKNIFNGVPAIQNCIQEDIGFTPDCAYHWARNVNCSRKHCAFIYLQSLMINQVGNFKVTPETITSATCSEASCEAGNPGDFVLNVGANRRRMNIRSEIARPKDQQCSIVGVLPKDAQGYNDWRTFMNPKC